MTQIPIPFRSNPNDFSVLGASKVVNAYAQKNGDDSKNPLSLVPVAGMKTFGPADGTQCRGMIYLEDEGLIYAVKGGRLTSLNSSGTLVEVGLVSGTAPVSMARNDAATQQAVILGGGFVYMVEGGLLSSLGLEFTPIDVTFCGGRFVFAEDNGTFHWSDINSATVNALSFANAEANPDGLTSVLGVGNTLYLAGKVTTEVWAVAESSRAPFVRVGGAALNIGTSSPHAFKPFNNGVVMVGEDNAVYQLNGYQYSPISSNEVSLLIERETDKSAIIGFTHRRGVNWFYTLRGSDWTREYNAATQTWADREDKYGNQWHCQHHVKAWGRDFFGDDTTGQIFEGDYTLFTDNSDDMPWGFDTQILHDSPNGLSFERIDLDVEVGDGESLTDEAEIIVMWSDDNKVTWKGERRLSLGKTGEYLTRVRASRLGQCGDKGRTFRVRITDNVKRAIAGMDAMVEKVAL